MSRGSGYTSIGGLSTERSGVRELAELKTARSWREHLDANDQGASVGLGMFARIPVANKVEVPGGLCGLLRDAEKGGMESVSSSVRFPRPRRKIRGLCRTWAQDVERAEARMHGREVGANAGNDWYATSDISAHALFSGPDA